MHLLQFLMAKGNWNTLVAQLRKSVNKGRGTAQTCYYSLRQGPCPLHRSKRPGPHLHGIR